jgi:RNA polymerase sigma factor (sigma-70 family)
MSQYCPTRDPSLDSCPPAERPPDRDALFRDFQPLVRSLVRQYSSDCEMDEDMVGEIYCRFSALLDAYDPARGIPLRPYLIRQLRASVYTYARSHWRRRERETRLEALCETTPAIQVPDPSPEWALELAMREVLNALPEAIATLPPRQRLIVIRRFYDSRSFDEIAAELRIRPATARSLLRYGLRNLRRKVLGTADER